MVRVVGVVHHFGVLLGDAVEPPFLPGLPAGLEPKSDIFAQLRQRAALRQRLPSLRQVGQQPVHGGGAAGAAELDRLDALELGELRAAEPEAVLDVDGALGVVRQLLLRVLKTSLVLCGAY